MIVCLHCGQTEDLHCEFTPRIVPDGCQCDPKEWDGDIPAPCPTFSGENLNQHCSISEHNFICHGVAT